MAFPVAIDCAFRNEEIKVIELNPSDCRPTAKRAIRRCPMSDAPATITFDDFAKIDLRIA